VTGEPRCSQHVYEDGEAQEKCKQCQARFSWLEKQKLEKQKQAASPPPHCVSRSRDIPVSQEEKEQAWKEQEEEQALLWHESVQEQWALQEQWACEELFQRDEMEYLQAQCEEVEAARDFREELKAASSQVSRVEAAADDSTAAWHASCARRSSGEAAKEDEPPAEDHVEAAYAMIRDRGEGLRKEPLATGGKKLRDKVMSFWMKQATPQQKGGYNTLRKSYYSLPKEDKVVTLEKFLMSEHCDADELLRADSMRQLARYLFDMAPADAKAERSAASRKGKGKGKGKKRPYFINTVSRLMLTWIGPWGRIAMHHLRVPLSSETAIDDVCTILRQHPMVPALWCAIQERIEEIVDSVLKPYRYTASLELCTDTFYSRGEVQLHVHMFIESNTTPFRVEKPADLHLFGTHPNLSLQSEAGNLPLTAARGRSSNVANAASGHYYLAMPKKGKVFPHLANCEPWKDYNVKVQWIHMHWQTCKLTNPAARAEYVNCKIHIEHHVKNVDVHTRIMRELQEKEYASRTQRAIAKITAPPVFIKDVEDWKKDFETVKMRYNFLVLEGDSQCGKTQYARSLIDPSSCFVADCSGTNHPDLRAFQHREHKVLLFDEISAERVIGMKKLFQAGNEPVLCGSSPTNQCSYTINVHGTMLVVASNNWSDQLAMLPDEDHRWLAANSIHLRIFGFLWQCDANKGEAPPYSRAPQLRALW
jgi:hypothetical protein